jgi:hypothetical protein
MALLSQDAFRSQLLLLLLRMLLRRCVGNFPEPPLAASRGKSAYAVMKQLPIDEWRQRRQQEAAWQAALRQQLAALQAEAGGRTGVALQADVTHVEI